MWSNYCLLLPRLNSFLPIMLTSKITQFQFANGKKKNYLCPFSHQGLIGSYEAYLTGAGLYVYVCPSPLFLEREMLAPYQHYGTSIYYLHNSRAESQNIQYSRQQRTAIRPQYYAQESTLGAQR